MTDTTFIISDLHLGASNCQVKKLYEFLDGIEDRCNRLILNGDVFDSMDFRRLNKDHWKVLSLLRKVSDKIEVVWVIGNHDGDAETIGNLLGIHVYDQFTFYSGQKKVLVLHGHQFDNFLTDHPILTWIGDLIYNLLQKLDKKHQIAKLAKRNSKHYLRNYVKVHQEAISLAKKLVCDIVCCGHTHNPYQVDQYLNSGSWTELPCTYIKLVDGIAEVESYDVR